MFHCTAGPQELSFGEWDVHTDNAFAHTVQIIQQYSVKHSLSETASLLTKYGFM
jgi:hypothetical protein